MDEMGKLVGPKMYKWDWFTLSSDDRKNYKGHYANILLQEIFALNLDSYISACMEFL